MYVKLFTQILDSSIADDRRLRHFFTDLLLCADAKGYVVMTETALARRIGADMSEVQWGLAELQKPDPQSHTPSAEGRRIEKLEGVGYGWHILNYEHYRAMKDADQLRESTKERVRRHREKRAIEKVGSVTVTVGNSSNANTEEKEEAFKEAKASSPTDVGRVSKADKNPALLTEIIEMFHRLCPALPRLHGIKDARLIAVRARWRDAGDQPLAWFEQLFAIAGKSRMCSEGKWCSFDWLMKPANAQKVLEGNYSDEKPLVAAPTQPISISKLHDQIKAFLSSPDGEAFRSYTNMPEDREHLPRSLRDGMDTWLARNRR